jgi:hypothetical protein
VKFQLNFFLLALVIFGLLPKEGFPVTSSQYSVARMATASPDECFGGIGASYQEIGQTGCEPGRQPKVNQAYVWGLAETERDLWMGTAANVNCLVEGTYLGRTDAYRTPSWVCEFGQSGYRTDVAPLLPATLGDWRPSQILRIPVGGGNLVNAGATMDQASQTLLSQTVGLRSAGTHNGVVLLAGPSMVPGQGLNVFAFNADNRAFLGSSNYPAFNNIRKWIVAKDELYTTVGVQGGTGALIRWTGSVQSPFSYVVVGTLPSEGAELVEHAGRIFVATWPYLNTTNPYLSTYAGVFESPLLPLVGGLPASNVPMVRIWDVRQYEPDLLIAASYGGGALASFDGQLIWGTMHVPGVATALQLRTWADYYSTLDPEQANLQRFVALLGTQRAIAIFSATGLEANEQPSSVRLLYGQANLPAFNPKLKEWKLVPNKSGSTPQLGLSGFNNPFNNYTWTMAVSGGGLFVGTMDWSYLLEQGFLTELDLQLPTTPTQLDEWLTEIRQSSQEAADILDSHGDYVTAIRQSLGGDRNPIFNPGADLMRFGNLNSPAQTISNDGLGNYLNYGFRTMIGHEDGLFIGTANPMNLMTSTTDGLPDGGWELLKLVAKRIDAIPSPIPTLSEWAKVIMALLMLVSVGFYWHRAMKNSS